MSNGKNRFFFVLILTAVLTATAATANANTLSDLFASVGSFLGITSEQATSESPQSTPAPNGVLGGNAAADVKDGKSNEEPIPVIGKTVFGSFSYPATVSTGVSLEDMSSGTTTLVAADKDDDASLLTTIPFTFY